MTGQLGSEDVIIVSPYQAPCGVLRLGSFGDALCLCDWMTERHSEFVARRLRHVLNADFIEGTTPILLEAATQLDAYFAGQRREFNVPLLFVGTGFQKKVWNALLDIPYGATVSYARLAARIGAPSAVRAVANANGANAISVFAPCHRVIGSDGSLTGYGGGLDAKRFLLNLESAGMRLF